MAKRRNKYPTTKCIAIDVDGTLVQDGKLSQAVANLAKTKKADGFEVILWSARGRRYAETVAAIAGIEDHFTAIVSKPGFIVDDLGWSWIKYTHVMPLPKNSNGSL